MNRIYIRFLTRYLRQDKARVAALIRRILNRTFPRTLVRGGAPPGRLTTKQEKVKGVTRSSSPTGINSASYDRRESRQRDGEVIPQGVSLSIVLVDNKQIGQLNRRFLRRNNITDVLSFPLADEIASATPRNDRSGVIASDGAKGDRAWQSHDNLIGEIIVSVEKAYQEAHSRKINPHQEILRYCIHGLLHLLGYDDHSPKDRRRMWARQEQILNKIF